MSVHFVCFRIPIYCLFCHSLQGNANLIHLLLIDSKSKNIKLNFYYVIFDTKKIRNVNINFSLCKLAKFRLQIFSMEDQTLWPLRITSWYTIWLFWTPQLLFPKAYRNLSNRRPNPEFVAFGSWSLLSK